MDSRSMSQWRFKMSVNDCLHYIFSMCRIVSTKCLLNRSNIFYPTWYGGVLSWSSVSCGKIGSLSWMSRSHRGLIFSICKQTWYGSTASYVGVSCVKVGLLRSRSRSQWRFKLLMNVYLDDVFWTTEHFVTKPDMIMQHHKPECHADNWFTVFSVKVTARAYVIKWLFLLYLLNCWLVCNQTWFDSAAL